MREEKTHDKPIQSIKNNAQLAVPNSYSRGRSSHVPGWRDSHAGHSTHVIHAAPHDERAHTQLQVGMSE